MVAVSHLFLKTLGWSELRVYSGGVTHTCAILGLQGTWVVIKLISCMPSVLIGNLEQTKLIIFF